MEIIYLKNKLNDIFIIKIFLTGLKIGLEQQKLELPKEIMDKYDQRAGCFIEQFKEYFKEPGSNDGTNSEDQVLIYLINLF